MTSRLHIGLARTGAHLEVNRPYSSMIETTRNNDAYCCSGPLPLHDMYVLTAVCLSSVVAVLLIHSGINVVNRWTISPQLDLDV